MPEKGLQCLHAIQWYFEKVYLSDPQFSDRQVQANSVDPDQTAPIGAVWSGSTLFAIQSTSFVLITLW